jgi:hypothetical protein
VAKVKKPPEVVETPGVWAFLHGTAAGVGSIATYEIFVDAASKGSAIVVGFGSSILLLIGVVLHNRAILRRATMKRCPKCKRPLPERKR